jgi:hypothetical protein
MLNKPWLHFLVLGLCLYCLKLWLQLSLPPPEPRLIYPPSEEKIAQLRGQWLRSTGRIPSAEQLRQLIEHEVDQEILFQEALQQQWHLNDEVVRQRLLRDMRFLQTESDEGAQRLLDDSALLKQALEMGLHNNDLVVRRRLIQRMEMQAFAPVRQSTPTEQHLAELYNNQAQPWVSSARLSFDHIYISHDQNEDAKRKAQEIYRRSTENTDVSVMSDPFLHGLQFVSLTQQQVASYFGAAFAQAVFSLATVNSKEIGTNNTDKQPAWSAPMSSTYGEHLVSIKNVQLERAKSFEEVRNQLIDQWRRQQELRALKVMLEQLRERYVVLTHA